jgi:hypothetical protein
MSSQPKTISLEIQNSFSSFNGFTYANATFRAAVNAISKHAAKLQAHSAEVP